MRFKSISASIFVWASIISLLPLIIVSEVFFTEFEREIEEVELRNLSRMADKKIEQITSYTGERIRNIETQAKNPIVKDSIIKLNTAFKRYGVNSDEYRQLDGEVRDQLTNFLSLGYYDLFVISIDGDIVFSVEHEADFATNLFEGPYKKTGLAEVTRDALAVLETGVSDFAFYKPSGKSAAFLATPILVDGKLIGVLALQVDIDHVLSVASDSVGMGRTGEILIAHTLNDRIEFIGQLKYQDKLDNMREIKMNSSLSIPMQDALSGESGGGARTDYRKEKVTAVWRYLPVFRWGLVVKKDEQETFLVVRQMNRWRWILFAFILLTILGAAYFLGNKIVQPIRNLIQASKKIASGDFRYRVKVENNDEAGQLAATFNQMTVRLQRTYDQLQNKVDEAERANQAKSQFLSHMSHELRTPLNAILGFAQLLDLDSDNLNENQRGNVREILDAGAHLLYLLTEVLDLAKIESGKMEVFIQPVSIDDIFQQCMRLIAKQAQAKQVRLIDYVSVKKYVVHADAARLKQVLLNLLSNAVKYNRDGGCVSLDAFITNTQRLRICVTDTGEGIAAQDIEKIFASFERLDAVNKTDGVGIGLVIAKQLTELMGGTIGIDSIPGTGSTFWVELELFQHG